MPPRSEAPTGPGSFAALGVPTGLCETLAAQGLIEAFPIQTATLPDALAGRDVLGQGRTGSGKTLAFALPIVARLAASRRAQNDRRPRALVLVPTRELAAQVEAVIKPLAASARLRSATIFGGVGAAPQIAALRAGTEIIIGCPGRLVDHMGTRALDLSGIEITVLDEADHMADVGFLPMVRRLLDATPQRGQRMLFSATLAGGVDQVVRLYMDDPVTHAVAIEAPIEMTHHVLVIHPDERLNVLAELARAHRSVVFTRTKHRAKQLRQKLAAGGLNVVELHGNLSQNARTANLDAFSDGSANVLVATDIAARGIHVDEVPLVVHADPPMEHKAYVHRSGRTARAGASGTVVTIATHDQVHEVRTLLRQANITATWSRLQANAPGALDALDGRGVTFDASGTGRSTPSRPAGARRPDRNRAAPAAARSSARRPSTGRG
jgi:superfamily II DNA/RNA helicase